MFYLKTRYTKYESVVYSFEVHSCEIKHTHRQQTIRDSLQCRC